MPSGVWGQYHLLLVIGFGSPLFTDTYGMRVRVSDWDTVEDRMSFPASQTQQVKWFLKSWAEKCWFFFHIDYVKYYRNSFVLARFIFSIPFPYQKKIKIYGIKKQSCWHAWNIGCWRVSVGQDFGTCNQAPSSCLGSSVCVCIWEGLHHGELLYSNVH